MTMPETESMMIQVVAFLIENFSDIQACPSGDDLGFMLESAGFGDDEISTTLLFMRLLDEMPADGSPALRHTPALRVYTPEETDALPLSVRSLLVFLENAHALNPEQREFIIHALMHLPPDEVTPDNAKMLAILVLWAHRSELPVLIGDELMAALHDKETMH